MADRAIFKELEGLMLKLDEKGLKQKVGEALDQGFTPAEIVLEGLAKGMQAVGDKFETGEYFLPELVASGKIMKGALEILRPRMSRDHAEPAGKVILATPKGDIHDIGKNIVGGLLEGNGFEVHDLGVDVPPLEILKQVQTIQAEVIGLSALVSTGVSGMSETVILIKERGIPIKVVIGGAATTQEAADFMQADAYARDAWEGVQIIKKWSKGGK